MRLYIGTVFFLTLAFRALFILNAETIVSEIFLALSLAKAEEPEALAKAVTNKQTPPELDNRNGTSDPKNRVFSAPKTDYSLLRDPFKPFNFTSQSTPNPLASPLETYALSQLQFKAIIRGAGVLKGLVEDDQGRGFYVSVGTRIGKHQGVIQEISDKKITIKETQTKFTGEKIETVSELYLKKG